MFARVKKGFTVAEMHEMETALRDSVLYSLNLSADDSQLPEKLKLKVELPLYQLAYLQP